MEKEEPKKEPVLHSFDRIEKSSMMNSKSLIILVIVILLGIGAGYVVAPKATVNGSTSGGLLGQGGPPKGTVEGSEDYKTYKDITQGVMTEGGKEGEGQFHLVRPGGDGQSVYLTSSNIDLSKYIGKKVKVWGETQKAQKVGWLMNVGRIEVLE